LALGVSLLCDCCQLGQRVNAQVCGHDSVSTVLAVLVAKRRL
jgi:hypothetical protein